MLAFFYPFFDIEEANFFHINRPFVSILFSTTHSNLTPSMAMIAPSEYALSS